MAESLGTAVLRLFADDSALRAGLTRAQQTATQAGTSIRNALGGAGGVIRANAFTAIESGLGALPGAAGQAGSAIASIAGGLAGLGGTGIVVAGVAAGMVALGAAAVGTANDLQRTINQLTVLTGSTDATNAIILNLKQYALETPFDLPGLADTAKQLLAFGLNGADAVEWTKRLGDIATVTGTPIERLGVNFSQIVSKGGASMVDLTQFAEAGLPIWRALSEVTGKSRAELEALPGAIPAAAVVAALESMTDAGGKFYEGGKLGATELDKQWATLVDSLRAAAVPLGQMITPLVLGAINNMISALQILEAGLNRIRDAAAGVAASGIGQLLGKAVNFATGGFLAPIAKAVVGPPAPPPPIPNTGKSLKDLLKETEASAQAAERAKQREKEDKKLAEELKKQKKLYEDIANAKVKAEGTVAGAQLRLAQAQAFVGLEDEALKIAQARAKIADAMEKRDQAATEFDTTLQQKGFNQNDPAVIAARANLEAAGIDVKTSMIEGSAQAKQALDAAAKRVKEAFDKFEKSQQGAFKLLSNRQQDELKRNAADKVVDLSNRRIIDLNNTLKELPGAFIGLGGKLDVSRVEPDKLFAVTETANGLVEAQTEVNKALAANTSALSENVKLLADKSWVVNVTAPGVVVASGDVLGGVP
jgi:tape measure domain-containing protein